MGWEDYSDERLVLIYSQTLVASDPALRADIDSLREEILVRLRTRERLAAKFEGKWASVRWWIGLLLGTAIGTLLWRMSFLFR